MCAALSVDLCLIPSPEAMSIGATRESSLDRGVEAILALSCRERIGRCYGSVAAPVTIVALDDQDGASDLMGARTTGGRDASVYRLVRLEAQVDAAGALPALEGDGISGFASEPRIIDEYEIEREFWGAVETLLLSAMIASPGDFAVEGAIHDGRWIPKFERTSKSDLYPAVYTAREYGWPNVQRLPTVDVHEWITAIPGWREGLGKGQAGKALSALWQIVQSYNFEPIRLVWAMVGIEALYSAGRVALQQQILEKSELLLGPRLTNKKRFAAMYDFRSRFVHGDLDMPSPFSDDAEYWITMDENADLATAVLLASIQELVCRGWNSFGVVTSIVGQREKA